MKKILFIDDDPDILEAVTIILEASGYEVVTNQTLLSTDKVSKINPDLIILDLLLKGESGEDMCEAIKQNKGTKEIPVIIMSAHPASKLISIVKKCDANDYIQKPFNMKTFLKVVDKNIPK